VGIPGREEDRGSRPLNRRGSKLGLAGEKKCEGVLKI